MMTSTLIQRSISSRHSETYDHI